MWWLLSVVNRVILAITVKYNWCLAGLVLFPLWKDKIVYSTVSPLFLKPTFSARSVIFLQQIQKILGSITGNCWQWLICPPKEKKRQFCMVWPRVFYKSMHAEAQAHMCLVLIYLFVVKIEDFEGKCLLTFSLTDFSLVVVSKSWLGAGG